MVEVHEDDIFDWYRNEKEKTSLERYLCAGKMLKTEEERKCLVEVFVPKEEPDEPEPPKPKDGGDDDEKQETPKDDAESKEEL